ncbi:4-alpha-glucanotransferase [Marinivivus vitaminiproducens]|uniref:4-alpha-glucanotransferase n=1 Tax=Marinivivus vitaminiproducens TaxID=3035935 RepID=UPI00279E7250|nr:4-alpha-glucanotransferase [Geminicoccaceae bacterium SCSIO 64248]
MTGALDRLADAYGILPGYVDQTGIERTVPDSTKRALLKALGVTASNAAEIRRSLADAADRSWRSMLPPIVVLRADRPLAVPVSLPAGQGSATLSWSLVPEAGQALSGETKVRSLKVVERGATTQGRYERRHLALPEGMATGYHRLEVTTAGARAETVLAVVPPRCRTPADLAGRERVWGLAAQLYGIETGRKTAIGDFADLARLAAAAAEQGAALIGVNPVHAMYPSESGHISPYSPSSRLFLNPLYIALDDLPQAQGAIASAGYRKAVKAARKGDLVDYRSVSATKRAALEEAYATFARENGADHRAFRRFCREGGANLARQALFDALDEHFATEAGRISWRDWPESYRDPDGKAVITFAREHKERVRFFLWLQFEADRQLETAQRRAREAGMPIGLYLDFAVGEDPGGAAAWGLPDVCVASVAVGSPPDPFSPSGQNWGLAPLSPAGLKARAYEPWLAAIRSAMRHAGAIRIDHAMGLTRLFWIPEGAPGKDGAYVRYPMEDMLGLLALESERNRCAVIGEDLGTVPEGFQERMNEAGVLSYRLLFFERDADGFRPPEAYPASALVSVSTHDLATLEGFWIGNDVGWRARIAETQDAKALKKASRDRRSEVKALCAALKTAGLLPKGMKPKAPPERVDDALAAACHRFLARTPSQVMIVQLEDLAGLVEQANLPGTIDEHPNWRRRLPSPVVKLFKTPRARAILHAVTSER